MKRKEIIYILLFFCVDQISKFLLETFLSAPLVVIPHFFSLMLLHNTGASWGLFQNERILLILLSMIALGFILNERKKLKLNKIDSIFYAMLCGGILGNLFDRIIFGYVKDFFSFTFGSYSFPVFNVADICIVIGGFYLFLVYMRGEKNANNSKNRKENKN